MNLDVDGINTEYEASKEVGFCMGDSTFRQDGFTIGPDFLRLEGRTISRGEFLPTSLQLQEIIGEGAFSKVHKAAWNKPNSSELPEEQSDDDRVTVAVKEFNLIDSSPQRQEMLLKELRALCKISCECLVNLEGAFLHDDSVTMVLEFMNRDSLEQILKTSGEPRTSRSILPERFVAAVLYQVLWGLSYLHRERIIHRDIKPGNILLHENGSVKLCDFGLASLMSDHSMQTTIVGTSRYMAPERLRGKDYGRRSDLWSLGLVLREALTGEIPWESTNSLVSLVMTVEEMSLDEILAHSRIPNDSVKEIMRSCLQHLPGRYRFRLSFVFIHLQPFMYSYPFLSISKENEFQHKF